MAKRARKFLGGDFLSFTISHLMGPDFIGHIAPVFEKDRAAALEVAMEQAYFSGGDSLMAEVFGKPFLHLWGNDIKSSRLPALFINTTRVQDSRPGVISNIRIGLDKRIDVLDELPQDTTLRLSTAVVLGARFPYVSPAGKIKKSYFVDGGYIDNSGAGTMLSVLQEFDAYMERKEKALHEKLRFYAIHIINDKPDTSISPYIHPVVNDVAAPLLTLAGSYTRQTEFNNQRLERFIKNRFGEKNYFTCSLYTLLQDADSTLEMKTAETYPMSWFISKKKRAEMDSALGRCKDIDRILAVLK